MIKTIFPLKDSTLYQSSQSLNAGIDEILDLEKIVSSSGGDLFLSRPIIQFDTTAISSSLAARGIHTGSEVGNLRWYLKMFISEERDINIEHSVKISAVSESWVMGQGRKSNDPITTVGCSWNYTDGLSVGTAWAGGVKGGSTHSADEIPEVTQTFNNVTGDIDVDVTSIVEKWHNGTITNNGFLISRPMNQELNDTEYGKLSYFSKCGTRFWLAA